MHPRGVSQRPLQSGNEACDQEHACGGDESMPKVRGCVRDDPGCDRTDAQNIETPSAASA
jgi:hypothetical protein